MDVGGRATQEQFAEDLAEGKSSFRAAFLFAAENREPLYPQMNNPNLEPHEEHEHSFCNMRAFRDFRGRKKSGRNTQFRIK